MISDPTENERTVTGMAEYIKQKIEKGKKSICDSCFHRNVCKGIGNQPCKKCNHYQDAADVATVRHGRWERDEWGSYLRRCSVCKKSPVYQDERGNSVAVYAGVCINCGAKMDGDMENYRPAEVIL